MLRMPLSKDALFASCSRAIALDQTNWSTQEQAIKLNGDGAARV
jgi:hypothetical protein